MKSLVPLLVFVFGLTLLPSRAEAQSTSRSPNSTKSKALSTLGNEFEPTRVLAIVGGEPIFVGDVLFEINQLLARFMPTAPKEIKQRERATMMKKILPKYIEQKLLLIDAKNGLPDGANFEDIVESASKEFEGTALENMMKSAGVDTPAMFDAHLRAQGSSLRKMRHTWTINQVVRFFLSQKIQSNSEVSHQELLKYYREHESEYTIKPRVRWEQVMARHDKFPTAADAMSAVVEMGNKIVYGASFAGVARKSSQGFRADEGGQHPWTNKDSLVLKELDAAIFSLPIGQLSDIIKSEQGFHIVRVIERDDATKVEFRDAQVEIRKKLESEKRVAAFDAHLEKLRKQIPVEMMEPEERSAQIQPTTVRH